MRVSYSRHRKANASMRTMGKLHAISDSCGAQQLDGSNDMRRCNLRRITWPKLLVAIHCSVTHVKNGKRGVRDWKTCSENVSDKREPARMVYSLKINIPYAALDSSSEMRTHCA